MEINVTDIVASENAPDHWYISNSVCNLGPNAAQITWDNAKNAADNLIILRTADQLEAMRDHIESYGAWGRSEIDAYSDQELNALAHQEIASEVNDLTEAHGIDLSEPLSQDEFDRLEQLFEEGQLSGRLYPVLTTQKTEWFYYIGE